MAGCDVTWTKLSDDFGDDCWTLSDAAFRAHVEGLTWSNRKLLDLRIPKGDVRRFAKNPEATTELVANGWWSDAGDAYLIRHHAQYQRSREDVLRQQETNAANGRKGGRPRKPPREQAADLRTPETESLGKSLTERDGTGLDRKDGLEHEMNGWPEVRRPHGDDLSDEGWQQLAPGYDR